MSARASFAAAAALGLFAACGPTVHGGDDDGVVDAKIDAAIDAPGGIDGSEEAPSRVYAHSGTMLYRIDTTTMNAVPIGAFTNLGAQSMTDIAVDRDEHMVGVTLNKVFSVDVNTAACTFLADFTGSNLTSLSFVPADAAQPDGPEVLVAATDNGNVVRIDISGTTATPVVIGDYGQYMGQDIVSSGDLVYVKGFGTVATVDVGTGPDYLATIDPMNNWTATIVGTGTTFDKIFGVAFWGGVLYGFTDGGTNAGAIIKLDRNTGVGTMLQPGTIRWFGAGVTTIAPIIGR